MTTSTEPQRKRATIYDVAERAGVSIAAVSKVMRGASGVSASMKERVDTAILELGYRPRTAARGMRGRTFTVGMAVPNVRNPFVPVLLDSAAAATRPAGYELMAGTSGDASEEQLHMIESLIDRQMDGLILVAPGLPDGRLDDVAARVPTVVIGPYGQSDRYDSVTGDDGVGAGLIIDHLAELGHRSIAFVANSASLSRGEHLPQRVRQEGYERAMRAHGLEDGIDVVEGAWTLEGGRSAARLLLAREALPTAIFAGADVAAFGVLAELLEAGVRVPEDISVVGFDDVPSAAFPAIALTTVSQSGELIGATAARLLLERLDGRQESRHVLVPSALIERSTTGRAP